MKSLLTAAICALFSVPAFTQNLSKITIDGNGNIQTIAIRVETNSMLIISETGNVVRWGEDIFTQNGYENFEDKLKDYMGRVEYYNNSADEAFRGKLKYLGSLLLTYYASYDGDELRGKLKSIGSTNITYYRNFEDEAVRGKIKTIGNSEVTWYTSFNNPAFKGRLKSVGSTELTYYSNSDDKAYAGKVKSIGGSVFTYYPSFDRQEYRGRMKTGTQVQTFNGVKFFVRN